MTTSEEIKDKVETQETEELKVQEEVEQLDHMNLLYEQNKIKSELIIFNKDKNPLFFNQIKNLLNDKINKINSPKFNEDKKSYYLKYIERGARDLDAQNNFIFNQNICLYIFLTIMTPTLRQEQILNYENQIEEINKKPYLPVESRSTFIFFYENEEELGKNVELKMKYPNSIFYVKTNTRNLELKMKETTDQLVKIILPLVKAYEELILKKEKLNEKIKYNKQNLPLIKLTAGEFLQIGENASAWAIIEKGALNYSYEEKGKWEETKCLLNIILQERKAKIENKKLEFDQGIPNLFEQAMNRYKNDKTLENTLYNLFRQCNYYSYFLPDKIKEFDKCLVKAGKIILMLNPDDEEYNFVQYLRISEFYKRANFMKKSNMYFLRATLTCFKASELKQMLPYMIKKLKYIFDIYDVSKNIIESFDQFKDIHKWLVYDKRKPISFFLKNDEDKFELFTKKKN